MQTRRQPKIVQFPMAYIGAVSPGNRKDATIPPALPIAIMPPIARAVAVEPEIVALRCCSRVSIDSPLDVAENAAAHCKERHDGGICACDQAYREVSRSDIVVHQG